MTMKSSSSYGASISARRSRARPSPMRSAPSSMSQCKAAAATCIRSSTTIWKRRAICSCLRSIDSRSPDGGTASLRSLHRGQPVGRNKRSALRHFISNTLAEVAAERRPRLVPERRNALRLLRPTVLLREFPAGLGLLAPILHALLVVHRAFADDLGKHEIRNELDLPVLEGGRRIRHALADLSQIGLLEAVAAAVAVCELVERRHAGSGQAAFDGHDQGGAVEAGFAQIGAVRHLRIHLAAVAGPAMAGLAVALLPKQTGALGNVAGIRGLGGEMHGRREQHARERCERYSRALDTGRPNSLTELTHAFASERYRLVGPSYCLAEGNSKRWTPMRSPLRRHARACRGHPRLSSRASARKTWMAGRARP